MTKYEFMTLRLNILNSNRTQKLIISLSLLH